MPIGMPEEALLTIQKRELPSDFAMPQMEIAATHYSFGYVLSGDRRIITPYQQIDVHAGDMPVVRPMLYHRTFSLSDVPYTNYLVKVSERLADDFCKEISSKIWNDVFHEICISMDEADSRQAESLLADMLEIYESKAEYADVLLKGMLYRLIVLMWEKNRSHDSLQFRNKLSKEVMEVMYYIEQNYAEDIKLKDAAEAAGFSEGHLSRLFTAQVGVTFSEYLINVRLRHVKEQLINTDRSVSEIAMMTGFSNADYLSSSFHRHEGMTPTVFRKGIRSDDRRQ